MTLAPPWITFQGPAPQPLPSRLDYSETRHRHEGFGMSLST